ncbi:hypothetical protein AVEN_272072-1, partial [Araneus ventricosus]
AEERVWKFIETVTGVSGPDNTIENWSKYRTVACADPEEEKKQKFEDFFNLCLEYWLEACIKRFSPICKEEENAAVSRLQFNKASLFLFKDSFST